MDIGISTLMIQRGRTGVAQHLFALLRALIPHTAAHRFTLFVLDEDLPLFTFIPDSFRIIAVRERFRAPLRNIFWHQVVLPSLARRLGLEVLHVPSYRRLLWQRPCALVGTVHDFAPYRLPGKYDRRRMFYGRAVVPRLVRRQDQIIAVSENTARDVARFTGLNPEKLTVIPNGLEHERFFPGNRQIAKAEALRRYGLDRPFFLYVARLEYPGKNHVRLISAFNQLKSSTGSDWQLVLGGSDWHGAEAIHAAVDQSPFAPDIRRIGFVPDDALPNLYRAADVLVYPSLFEGFGLPPLEAMACGCPVISSTRGGLEEVVVGAAATVNPDEPGSIAAQMQALAADENVRKRLIAAGLARAREFNWHRAAESTIGVYAKAVERHASGLRSSTWVRDSRHELRPERTSIGH